MRSLVSTQGGSGGSMHHLNSQSLTVKQDFSPRPLFCGNIGNSRVFWKNGDYSVLCFTFLFVFLSCVFFIFFLFDFYWFWLYFFPNVFKMKPFLIYCILKLFIFYLFLSLFIINLFPEIINGRALNTVHIGSNEFLCSLFVSSSRAKPKKSTGRLWIPQPLMWSSNPGSYQVKQPLICIRCGKIKQYVCTFRIMIIHIIVHHYVPGFWLTWKPVLRISDLLVSWARSPGSLLIFRGRHQIHRPLPLWRHKHWRVSLINTTPGAFTLEPHRKEVRGSFHSTDLLIKDCSHLFSLFWSWGGWGHQAHCWTLISVSLFPFLAMFG